MQLGIPFSSPPFHFISFLLTDVPEIGKEIRGMAGFTDRCEELNSIPNEHGYPTAGCHNPK